MCFYITFAHIFVASNNVLCREINFMQLQAYIHILMVCTKYQNKIPTVAPISTLYNSLNGYDIYTAIYEGT